MKKRYQMESQRAVQNLRRVAKEEKPTLNMMLPMSEVVGMLQQGVGELLRQAGLELMNLVMEEEVRSLVGKRGEPNAGRSSYRWGSEDGVLRDRRAEGAAQAHPRARQTESGTASRQVTNYSSATRPECGTA